MDKKVFLNLKDNDISIDEMNELKSELLNGKSNLLITNNQPLFYLLIMLKNKNIKFDSEYLNLVLKITQILNSVNFDIDKSKFTTDFQSEVLPNEFCQMLTFLAIDYNRVIELKEDSDLSLLNILCSTVLQELSNLVVYQEYDNLLEEIKKYNEIIYNILLNNQNYMKNYIFRKAKFYKEFYKKNKYIDLVDNSSLNLENSIFLITTKIFISNIRTFNYDYSLISETMNYMINYINENYNYIINGSILISDIQEHIFSILNEMSSKKIYAIKN